MKSVTVESFLLFLSKVLQGLNGGFFRISGDLNWAPTVFGHLFRGVWVEFREDLVQIGVAQLVGWWHVDKLVVVFLGLGSGNVEGGAREKNDVKKVNQNKIY